MKHSHSAWCCQRAKLAGSSIQQRVTCTFLHVPLEHGSVSENKCVEDGLAGGVEGPVQADVTADLFATAVLAVNVPMDQGKQEVQASPYGAAGGGRTEGTQGKNNGRTNAASCFCVSCSTKNIQHRDELGPGQEASQVPGGSLAEDSRLRWVLQDLPQVIQECLGQGLQHKKKAAHFSAVISLCPKMLR